MKQMVRNWRELESLEGQIIGTKDGIEFGKDVEVDGNLKVNSSITDSEGNEAIDIGTEDLSIHKNVNIGSVAEPENLFVSGEITNKQLDFLNEEGIYDISGKESITVEEFNQVFLPSVRKYGKIKNHAAGVGYSSLTVWFLTYCYSHNDVIVSMTFGYLAPPDNGDTVRIYYDDENSNYAIEHIEI